LASGQPPYALADQSGTIQRFVEPVPEIDLAPYVGAVVSVRHDTGRTLLATQLELPPPPLLPMVGAESRGPTANRDTSAIRSQQSLGSAFFDESAHGMRPVGYIDDDDSTTELTSDSDDAAADNEASGAARAQAIELDAGYPVFPDGLPPISADGTLIEPIYSDFAAVGAIPEGASTVELLPGVPGIGSRARCPQCGGIHGPSMVGGSTCDDGYYPLGDRFGPGDCRFSADLELMFLRLHLMDGAVGKLSEQYELSPRLTLGFDIGWNVDGRLRLWRYDQATRVLGGGSVRFDFSVLDLEAIHCFTAGRSDVALSAGLRLAKIELTDDDDDEIGNDLIGLTVAADGHTPLFRFSDGQLAWVYGGRLSIVGGDWGGDGGSDFIPVPAKDDNIVSDEIYIGLQYATRLRGINVQGRMAFEMQNWHSDAFAQNSGTDSIGFLGPSLAFGAEF
jgi:hypothetical protein